MEITTIPIADKHMYTQRHTAMFAIHGALTSLRLIVILQLRTEAESTSGSAHAQVNHLENLSRPHTVFITLWTQFVPWVFGQRTRLGQCSLIPRPSPAPVFDRLQYAKSKTGAGEGLETRLCYRSALIIALPRPCSISGKKSPIVWSTVPHFQWIEFVLHTPATEVMHNTSHHCFMQVDQSRSAYDMLCRRSHGCHYWTHKKTISSPFLRKQVWLW